MSEIEFVYATIKKINAKLPVSPNDIITAQAHLQNMIMNEQYPGSKAEAKRIGALLSKALSKH